MNLVNIIQKIALDVYRRQQHTDITYGTVKSINPLTITLFNGTLELNDYNLILTENVIRKEISITAHTHYFKKDTFVHNHGSPLKYPQFVTVDGSNTVALTGACSAGGGPVTGTVTWQQTKGEVTLDEGSLDKDLTAEEEDIVTLKNREPTATTLKVRVNGQDIPLSKDPDGEMESDENSEADDTDVYWGVLNHGLQVGDKVLLLRCQGGDLYVVLSKVYQYYHYREDEA